MNNPNHMIDILGTIFLLWRNKCLIMRNCIISFIVSLIIAFSIPKEYTSIITIAPELPVGENGLAGSLGSLAQMAGVNIGGLSGNEALYPDLYPQIVSSTPFLVDMLSVNVQSLDGSINTNLYDYLENNQKSAWWDYPIIYLKRIFKSEDKRDFKSINDIDSKKLDRKQLILLDGFASKLDVKLDKTTSLIYVSATMQDPFIASTVAEAVTTNLVNYLNEYYTVKERGNIKYLEQLYSDALSKYELAQHNYSQYTDSHQVPFLTSVKSKQLDLENEMQFAYTLRTQVAQQLEAAKAKLQENKPVISIIQPPISPFKASSPNKIILVITFVFFAFFGTSLWIFIKKMVDDYVETP
jgi:uncharacterized protein involved in exopolysaccharide biosynthesis